jgi:CHAT domain
MSSSIFPRKLSFPSFLSRSRNNNTNTTTEDSNDSADNNNNNTENLSSKTPSPRTSEPQTQQVSAAASPSPSSSSAVASTVAAAASAATVDSPVQDSPLQLSGCGDEARDLVTSELPVLANSHHGNQSNHTRALSDSQVGIARSRARPHSSPLQTITSFLTGQLSCLSCFPKFSLPSLHERLRIHEDEIEALDLGPITEAENVRRLDADISALSIRYDLESDGEEADTPSMLFPRARAPIPTMNHSSRSRASSGMASSYTPPPTRARKSASSLSALTRTPPPNIGSSTLTSGAPLTFDHSSSHSPSPSPPADEVSDSGSSSSAMDDEQPGANPYLTQPGSPATLALLTAEPLVVQDCSTLPPQGSLQPAIPVSPVQASNERGAMERIHIDSGLDSMLQISHRHLSMESLGEALTIMQPDILHLSGHGTILQNDMYALAFEGESGSADLITTPRIGRLLGLTKVHNASPELVFLSACHSELAAHLFMEAGCHHVIACRARERILDRTARYFMRFFYAALFKGHTVRTAFDLACVNVDAAIDASDVSNVTLSDGVAATPESKKFMLLPVDGDHDIALFPKPCHRRAFSAPGQRQQLAVPHSVGSSSRSHHGTRRRIPTNLPSRTCHTVGRHAEVQQTIGLLRSHRAVSIFGPPKYGKTTVAKAASHYLHDRRRFPAGTFWIDMQDIKTCGEFTAALLTVLEQHVPDFDIIAPAVHRRASSSSSVSSPATRPRRASADDASLAALPPSVAESLSQTSGDATAGVSESQSVSTVAPNPSTTTPSSSSSVDNEMDQLLALLHRIRSWVCLLVLDGCSTAVSNVVIQSVLKYAASCRVMTTATAALSIPVEHGFSVGLVFVRELPVDSCLELMHRLAPWMLMNDDAQGTKYRRALELIARCRQSPCSIRTEVQELCIMRERSGDSIDNVEAFSKLMDQTRESSIAATAHPEQAQQQPDNVSNTNKERHLSRTTSMHDEFQAPPLAISRPITAPGRLSASTSDGDDVSCT